MVENWSGVVWTPWSSVFLYGRGLDAWCVVRGTSAGKQNSPPRGRMGTSFGRSAFWDRSGGQALVMIGRWFSRQLLASRKACPPTRSQNSLPRKLVSIPLMISWVQNFGFAYDLSFVIAKIITFRFNFFQLTALDATQSLQTVGLYPQETIFVEER